MGMFLRQFCAYSLVPRASAEKSFSDCRPPKPAGYLFCGCAGRALTLTVAITVLACLVSTRATASQYVMLDYNLTLNPRARDTVFLELFDDKPLTTANFLNYVNNTVTHGNYNGSIMHRLSRNFVLQGGGFWPNFVQELAPLNVSLDPNAVIDLDGNLATANPTVVNEHNQAPIRSNLTGTIAMARIGGQPNSASNQWFVNLADNTNLDSVDGGFTVFGEVAGDGMTLFNAFNTLSIANLNPDVDDDGFRDGGPFFFDEDANGNVTDGVPFLHGGSNDILVVLEKATQVDYLGSGLTTTVPIAGIAFTSRDAFIDTGTVFTGASTPTTGMLTIGSGRRLGIREGFALNRALFNHGTVAPGLQVGSATVQSDYKQYFDGALEIQIASATPAGQQYADTQYDRLIATGTAFLDGQLSVSLLTGFVPAAGNSFTVLTASSIIGTFGSYDLPLLPAGDVWNVSKTSTAFTLSVVAADFNRNGVVDTADYVVWRKTNGLNNVTPYSGADGNGDGKIDALDYNLWRANFGNLRGNTSGAGSGSSLASRTVPEPGSAILLLYGALPLAARRSRRATIRGQV